MITKLKAVLLLLIMILWGGAAQATPITWYLAGIVFDDQHTAAGSFDYDADSNTFSNIFVTSESGYTYNNVNPFSSGNAHLISFVSDAIPIENVTHALLFDLGLSMTNSGGTIDILPGSTGGGPLSLEGTCVSGSTTLSCASVGSRTFVTDGSITTAKVPVPATLALILIGFAGLGFRKTSVN